MILKVFAMRDVKADAFGSPFFLPSEGVARRMLGEWVQDKRSEVAKYPSEFDMYLIGTFNNETGLMTPCTIELVCSAAACLPKPDPRQLVLPVPTQNEEVAA